MNDTTRLQDFFYILVRDHLPLGTVESIMWDQVHTEESEYCNPWLAGWAEDMAQRLTDLKLPITNYNNMYKDAFDKEGVMGPKAKEYDSERPPYPVGVELVMSDQT